jgi:hypothetical protein
MSQAVPFQYAVIRIVPHEARGEFINAGVVLYCADARFLQARIAFDAKRLTALAPLTDIEHVQQHLAAIPKICAGGKDAGALGELSMAERFRWLTAPRNTIIQPSPVHSGLTENPAATLDHLLETLVIVSA